MQVIVFKLSKMRGEQEMDDVVGRLRPATPSLRNREAGRSRATVPQLPGCSRAPALQLASKRPHAPATQARHL